MFLSYIKSLIRGVVATAAVVGGFGALLFAIDAVEFARTGSVGGQLSNGGVNEYAKRISAYSLVSLGVIGVNTDEKFYANRDDELFSCVGNLRVVSDREYIDLTALAVAIIGVENYNRGYWRRSGEAYAQDFVRRLGGKADYTIGLAQIRTSLAEKIYRSKMPDYAGSRDIQNYARNDCGSARLAAMHIGDLVSECRVEKPESILVNIFECVVRKYTGMNDRQREYGIYVAAVNFSYGLLFNQESEFYYAYEAERMKIGSILAGECAAFDSGREGLSGAPKNRSLSASQPQGGNFTTHLTIDGLRIDEQRSLLVGGNGIVKILTPVSDVGLNFRPSESLTNARRKTLVQYACSKYQPVAVQFYRQAPVISWYFSRYCGSGGPSSDEYVLLATKGGITARDDYFALCAAIAIPAQ